MKFAAVTSGTDGSSARALRGRESGTASAVGIIESWLVHYRRIGPPGAAKGHV